MESQTESNNRTSQDIKEIKNALATLTASLRTQEKGKFPAQPQPNPSTQSFASCSTEIQQENASSITTLRSGKAVDKSIPSKEKEPSLPPMSNGKDEGKSESVDKLDKEKDVQYAPFPQRLQPTKNINQNAEIFELFKQVKINIPLLDAIKQVSSYAKFLKDMCTVERKHNV